jgi:hypothetical protein
MIAITTSNSTNVNAEWTRTPRTLNGQALLGITKIGLSSGALSFSLYQSAIKRQK